jgi:hypothetical protein
MVGPEPDDVEFDGTLRLIRNIELSLEEHRVKTRMDADNALALLEARQTQVEQELVWSRLISPTMIRSLNGEMESLDELLVASDPTEERLTLILKRMADLRTRLLGLVDEPNQA